MRLYRAHLRLLLLLTVFLFWSVAARADDETSLFDSRGRATAYISDDLTIFLWTGKPVAFLESDAAGGFHIYGFNGKQLGWFVRGIARDHQGNGVCSVKEVLRSTEFEPFKGFKEFKPFKNFKEFAPFRPTFSREWSEMPCRLFLLQGAS